MGCALIVAAADRRTMQLRRWFATLTRLETLIPGSARLPITRDEYDAVAYDFPSRRCRIATSGFEAQGTWIACDFRLAPTLGAHGGGGQVRLPPRVQRQRVAADRRAGAGPQSAQERTGGQRIARDSADACGNAA